MRMTRLLIAFGGFTLPLLFAADAPPPLLVMTGASLTSVTVTMTGCSTLLVPSLAITVKL